jgi:hypothetical protein
VRRNSAVSYVVLALPCFASQNPNFPMDHDSHCKHAIGQLGKCGNR